MSNEKKNEEGRPIEAPDYEGFPWNHDPIVEEAYAQKNYRIELTEANTKKAIVFFSGNGIYANKNRRASFLERIVEYDRYEWWDIGHSSKVSGAYEKIIFMRDIYAQYYLRGVNKNCDTQEKMGDLLRKETEGYDVTVCGSSAGAFAAAVLAEKIGAKRLYGISGCYDLNLIYGMGPILDAEINNPNTECTLNACEQLKRCGVRIYNVYAGCCDTDMVQTEALEGCNVLHFAFDSESHAKTMRNICYPTFLTLSDERMQELADRYEGRLIQKTEWEKALILGR